MLVNNFKANTVMHLFDFIKDIYLFKLLLLVVLGLITGFTGTNAGGSSMINVPIMIWLGSPFTEAISCARIASVGTMLSGLRQFHKHKKVDYKLAFQASIFSILGALIGAEILFLIPETLLQRIVGIIILSLVVFSMIKVKIKSNIKTNTITMPRRIIGLSACTVTGAVGGFFGAQSKLVTFVFQLIFNKSISESAGTRKVTGLVVATTSLIIYGMHGIINWSFGLSLISGTLVGSHFGSSYGLKKGDDWMQTFFNIIVSIIGIALILGWY